jgi:hypothetical protein
MSTFKKRLNLDHLESIRLYYRSPRFALLDLSFGFLSLFSNPYRTCRKFLEKQGVENIYAYGETPLQTYERIVRECDVGAEDTWIEMGAGRGKGCFWLSHFVRCRVIGVEWIPQFVRRANLLKTLFQMRRLEFQNLEIEKADLSQATVIYLYGLWPALDIPKGVKVITISEPLEGFSVIKTFWVRYPWGRTSAFLQIR